MEQKVKTNLQVSISDESKQARPLTYDEIKVGDELPAFNKWITSQSAVRFGKTYEDIFSGHINPEVSLKQFGRAFMPVQGAVIEAGVTPFILNWLRSTIPWLCGGRQESRFIQVVLPGDTLTYRGKVIEKKEENDKKYVTVDVWADNQKGEKVLAATCRVAF